MGENKFGRDSPCPCGSGKKYQDCHLQKIKEKMPANQLKAEVKQWADNVLAKLDKDIVQKRNEEMFARVEEEFRQFKKDFNKGNCPDCKRPLDHFLEDSPCVHWLLKKDGLRKKHFEILVPIFETWGMFRLQSFLRWIANIDKPFANISDDLDGNESMVVESTIRYKNFEWSFSSAKTDYAGHRDAVDGVDPHYHFQMKVDGLPVVKFNDFHIRFAKEDIFNLELMINSSELFQHTWGYGSSITEMAKIDSEAVVNTSTKTEDDSKGTIRIQSMVLAKEGELISGNDLADLIEESKRTGKPLASLLHKIKNVSVTSVLSEGPAVVDKSQRSKRKKKK